MKWPFIVSAIAVIVGIGLAVRLWVDERKRREVFPASSANALLNPLRRLIQRPESVVAAFGIRPGDVVLEVGPGPGYFTAATWNSIQPGGRLICFDLQPEMLKLLRNRLADIRVGLRVDLVAGDAMHLPFRPGVIDSTYLVSVLGEVPEPQAAVIELRRVLRTGGTASFCETVNDPDYVRLSVMRELCSTADLGPLGWRRQLLGYIAQFSNPV